MEKRIFAQHILLADDDEDDCLFFNLALKELGVKYVLSIVNNGVELIEFLKAHSPLPDVLFLDLNMPLKTGFSCLSEIKQDADLMKLKVIALSTSNYPEQIKELYRNGILHFFTKPTGFEKLKECIDESLKMLA